MSRWYRAYAGTASDPKLGEAALIAETSRSVCIAVWHALLESAAETNEGGRIDTTARRIAAMLGEKVAVVDGVIGAFEEIGLVKDSCIAAWAKRQYESDNSTERSRAFRERQKSATQQSGNGDATLRDANASPPETETETETEKKEGEVARRAPPTPKACRLPDDWAPVDGDLTFAAQHLPLDRIGPVFDKFRDYWVAKAGAGGRKQDWSATWRNWVRREVENGGSPRQSAQSRGSARRDGNLAAALASCRDEGGGPALWDGDHGEGMADQRGPILPARVA